MGALLALIWLLVFSTGQAGLVVGLIACALLVISQTCFAVNDCTGGKSKLAVLLRTETIAMKL